jgi:hypothetical protein
MRSIPTLIPTDFWFRTVLIVLIALALGIWLALFHPEAFSDRETLKFWGVGLTGFLVVSLFDLYLRRGYKVSYDDGAIYWRKVGISRSADQQVAMPFDAITEVLSEPGSLGIRPFEAAVLRAAERDLPDIILSRMYLRDHDIREILAKVSEGAGVVLDDEIRAFL